jgi:N-acetylneuraminic acid mutarotase
MILNKRFIIIYLSFFTMTSNARQMQEKAFFTWKQESSIPDKTGFAGSYAGVSNGALLVAGGANFPDNKRPWTNGIKTWYDKIYILETPGGSWKIAGKLPKPSGYGASLSFRDGVICIGGGDMTTNYADVFMLTYKNGKIETAFLPSLPVPLINASAAMVNNSIFITGGLQTPGGITENGFYSLDLTHFPALTSWNTLSPFPGVSRMLATAGSQDGSFYIFGGIQLVKNDEILERQYLKDCWKFNVKEGWKRLADLPYPLAATPSPAYSADNRRLLLFGGDDGALASKVANLKDAHPGFRNEILGFNTITGGWVEMGKMPTVIKKDAEQNPNGSIYAPVTTSLVIWNRQVIIPGGEVRPAVRTNKVLAGSRLYP